MFLTYFDSRNIYIQVPSSHFHFPLLLLPILPQITPTRRWRRRGRPTCTYYINFSCLRSSVSVSVSVLSKQEKERERERTWDGMCDASVPSNFQFPSRTYQEPRFLLYCNVKCRTYNTYTLSITHSTSFIGLILYSTQSLTTMYS